jgi:hypothetical protein
MAVTTLNSDIHMALPPLLRGKRAREVWPGKRAKPGLVPGVSGADAIFLVSERLSGTVK